MNLNVHNAIIFAARKHAGQARKGTDIPYITHPMEVMQILTDNDCSEQVILAGILHDTLEDTNATQEEIGSLFGNEVLRIVNAESEDKSKTWRERKQASIDHQASDSLEAKLVCCADKLANLRSMAADKSTVGERLWDRFNAGKDDIHWYYKEIVKALCAVSEYKMYQELKNLTSMVFGS
ncbi:MAG: HD domain-containing protein [Treponema sp.]|jgi:(p)ppGpp synthase/HD superfamily hydrolase|nr:HD domain-containing protein [Treponema sp.]